MTKNVETNWVRIKTFLYHKRMSDMCDMCDTLVTLVPDNFLPVLPPPDLPTNPPTHLPAKAVWRPSSAHFWILSIARGCHASTLGSAAKHQITLFIPRQSHHNFSARYQMLFSRRQIYQKFWHFLRFSQKSPIERFISPVNRFCHFHL